MIKGIDWKNINSKNKMEIGREWGITYAAISRWVGGWLSEYGHRNTQYIITIVISIIIDVSYIIIYHFQLRNMLYLVLQQI